MGVEGCLARPASAETGVLNAILFFSLSLCPRSHLSSVLFHRGSIDAVMDRMGFGNRWVLS